MPISWVFPQVSERCHRGTVRSPAETPVFLIFAERRSGGGDSQDVSDLRGEDGRDEKSLSDQRDYC